MPISLPAAAVPGEQEALSAATVHEKRQRAPRLDWAGLLKRTFIRLRPCLGERSHGVTDFEQYALVKGAELMPDF